MASGLESSFGHQCRPFFLGGSVTNTLADGDYFVSVITEMELLSYRLDPAAETEIRSFLSEITVVPFRSRLKALEHRV